MKHQYFDAPGLKHIGDNAYKFVNAVSDFATHAKPLIESEKIQEFCLLDDDFMTKALKII